MHVMIFVRSRTISFTMSNLIAMMHDDLVNEDSPRIECAGVHTYNTKYLTLFLEGEIALRVDCSRGYPRTFSA